MATSTHATTDLGEGLVTSIADLAQSALTPHGVKVYDKTLVFVKGQLEDTFTDPNLRQPDVIKVTTLQSVADFFKESPNAPEKRIVHIASPTEVRVIVPHTGDYNQTLTYLVANAPVPPIRLDTYMDPETFMVNLLSHYEASTMRDQVIQSISEIKSGVESKMTDDGTAQSVQTRRGVTRSDTTVIKNPVYLRPYRTFTEVDQPESAFVLRMRQLDDNSVQLALFAADGGGWIPKAIRNVADWLRAELDDPDDTSGVLLRTVILS